jgi:hypothetical protein
MRIVMEVVINPPGEIDHFLGLGDHLGLAAEAREKMADVAVVLLDGEGQVLAGEELVFGDETVKAFPVVGDEGLALEADLINEPLTGFVITATKHPGDGAASDRVVRAPNPELASLLLRKCHLSSSVMMTLSAVTAGSGSRRASFQTQFSTATSLTPRMRAMLQKLILPIAYSINANAFIAGGLPRNGVSVKWYRQVLHL